MHWNRSCSLYLLGRGRFSATIGVETGVFFEALLVDGGAALPERTCRLGEPSTCDGAGPTDCDRSMNRNYVAN